MVLQRKLIYYLNFIKDLNFIPVILAPLVLSHHLNLSDLILIISVFRITQVICNIPIGVFSDYFGPVTALRLSSFFVMLSIFCLLPSTLELYHFIWFNIFSALSVCLLSSSSSKLLKIIEPDTEKFAKQFAWTLSLRRLGIMLSGLVASALLLKFDLDFILKLQVILGFLLLIISFRIDVNLNLRPTTGHKVFKHLIQGLKQAPMERIFSVAVISSSFFIAFDVFLQPFMVAAAVPKWMFPFMLATANFCVFLSLNLGSVMNRFFNLNYHQGVLLPLTPLLIMALTNNPYLSLMGLMITILMRSVGVAESVKLINDNPITNQGMNDSLVNTVSTAITASFSLLFGFLLKDHSLQYATAFVLGSFISCLLLYTIIRHWFLNREVRVN